MLFRPSPREKALRLTVIALALLWSGFPIVLVVLSSFKPPREIFNIPPDFVFWPVFTNYVRLWQLWPEFFADMRNSLIITLGATILTVITTTMAGYVYSRYRTNFLTASAFFMIFIRMLPPIIITLPLFPVVNWMHLNDTHILLIGLYATFFVSLSTWIMKAFIDQIPRQIEEAAIIDGAGSFQIITRIILPLAIHGIIASSIFVFVFSWNEFIFALVFTTRDARTTPLAISEILGTVEGVDWGVLFAAATIQLVPILIFVIIVQRYVLAGLAAGAIKG